MGRLLSCALVVVWLSMTPWRAHSFPVCLVQLHYAAGYDVDLIRWIANDAGWVELVGFPPFIYSTDTNATQFYFTCTILRATAMVDILVGNDTLDVCAMGAGAITVTEARWSQGIRFSYPYYRTGVGVLISNSEATTVYNPWAFLKPFHWTIWTALLLTLTTVPIIIWVVENLVQTGSLPLGKESIDDWRHAIFTTLLTVFNLECLTLLSLPSQLILISFCFLNLVIVSTYTANLAAAITTAIGTTGITAWPDLRGKNVAAHDIYVQRLAQNDYLTAQPLTWNGSQTFLYVADRLSAGTLDAYIFDRPILQYWKNVYDRCDLSFVGEFIEQFDYGTAFNQDLDPGIINQFQISVLTAQASAVLEKLSDQWIPDTMDCPNASTAAQGSLHFLQYLAGAFGMAFGKSTCQRSSTGFPACFFQISGLWIILGSAIFFGLLSSIYSIYHVHYSKDCKEKLTSHNGSQARNSNGRLPSMPSVQEEPEPEHCTSGSDAASVTVTMGPSLPRGQEQQQQQHHSDGTRETESGGQNPQYHHQDGDLHVDVDVEQPAEGSPMSLLTPFSGRWISRITHTDDKDKTSLYRSPLRTNRTASGELDYGQGGSMPRADRRITDAGGNISSNGDKSVHLGRTISPDSSPRKKSKRGRRLSGTHSNLKTFARDLASKVFVKPDGRGSDPSEPTPLGRSPDYFDLDMRLYYGLQALLGPDNNAALAKQLSGGGPVEPTVTPPTSNNASQRVLRHSNPSSAGGRGGSGGSSSWAHGPPADYVCSKQQYLPGQAAAASSGKFFAPSQQREQLQHQQSLHWQSPNQQHHFRPALEACEFSRKQAQGGNP